MSQGLRDMLANRRFAIPLIILLAFCFVGLILVGIVLILRPEADEPVAEVADTPAAVESTTAPTATTPPTEEPTPRPSPTLVPLGTLTEPVEEATAESSTDGNETPSTDATPEATENSDQDAQATATPIADEELADTGIGWGLVIFAGIGMGLLAVAARRLRLAQ